MSNFYIKLHDSMGVAILQNVIVIAQRIHTYNMATVLRALSEYKLCTSTVVFGRSRAISTTAVRNGLEEFFPRTDDPLEEAQKIGRPWRARELRHKSNADLHKLWYGWPYVHSSYDIIVLWYTHILNPALFRVS